MSHSHKHLTPNFGVGLTPLFLQCSKPTPITRANLQYGDKSLQQNAAQCMLLDRILPFLVADCFNDDDDDDDLECYVCLLKIIHICLSPVVTIDSV